MGSARSMTGGDLSLVKYMQDKQDKSDIHPPNVTYFRPIMIKTDPFHLFQLLLPLTRMVYRPYKQIDYSVLCL